MRSARTDSVRLPLPTRIRSPLAWLGRLNVRLALILAGVALVALLVSGIALSQILPGFFLDQAQRRSLSAALLTAASIQENTDRFEELQPEVLRDPVRRNEEFLQPVAEQAANLYAQGTVEIRDDDGNLLARAEPNEAAAADLREAGLRPDPAIPPQPAGYTLPIPPLPEVRLIVTVRDPYTNRELTLQRVSDTLVGAGLAALTVSILIGTVGARAFTRPLARLRRTSSRFAHGELDERAPTFGILEVDDLGQQFNLMADQLSESLRLLEADRDRLREFIADVSHELRTPIAALRTFTDLQRDGNVSEEQRTEFLERSREQIARLEWMSNNLLDLSRIDAGIFPLDVRWGDLRDPVRATVEAHAEMAEQRGVSLAFEVPTSPVMLRFDRERIVQLLTNLVGNALKFTQRDGEVVVSVLDSPESAVLEVRDSGPGIPEDELPHIFDRFFRGTNVGEARASGSGLGLAIARSIVDMHGGEIRVLSAPGRGATFTVRLPHEQAEGQ